MNGKKDEYYTYMRNEVDNDIDNIIHPYVKELEKQNKELIECLIKHITCKDSRDLSIYADTSKKLLKKINKKF